MRLRLRWPKRIAYGLILVAISGNIYLFVQLRHVRSQLDRVSGAALYAQGHKSDDIGKAVNAEDRYLYIKRNDAIVLYNRVPKTGSTTVANIVYNLCLRNAFHMIHINTTRNSHVLNVVDQLRFVRNVTSWKQPTVYHGHLAFLDFTRFGFKNPIYINVIREPLERMVSYYYFLRHGDDFRPGRRRARAGKNETFDDCVGSSGYDCSPDSNLWMQVPFFCGHADECRVPGSEWAMQQAKHNLINHYLLVGVTEKLGEFIMVLEALLPSYLNGATELYQTGPSSHLRHTARRKPPLPDTIAKLRQSRVWQMEDEFYQFARDNFLATSKLVLELRTRNHKDELAAGPNRDLVETVSLDYNANNPAPHFAYDKVFPDPAATSAPYGGP